MQWSQQQKNQVQLTNRNTKYDKAISLQDHKQFCLSTDCKGRCEID